MKTNNIPILITGCNGVAGYWLIKELERSGHTDIYGMDISVFPPVERMLGPKRYFRSSITDRERLDHIIRTVRPMRVFHLAAILNKQDPQALEDVNVGGTELVLQTLLANGLTESRVVIPSSSAVYGDIGSAMATETSPLKPVNAYGDSKLRQEQVALRFHEQHKMSVIIARTFNNTAPYEKDTMVCSNLAKQVAEYHAQKRSEIVCGNIEAWRDFTDTRDVVRAYRELAERGVPGEIYNICSGKAVQIRSILDHLYMLAGIKNVPLRTSPPASGSGDIDHQTGSNRKISEATGWSPRSDILRDTLPDLYRFWQLQVNPLHICYIGNAANVHEQRWMKPVADAGHRITIISDTAADLPYANVILYEPEKKYRNSIRRFIGAVFDLRRTIRTIDPDIVHFHFISGLAFTAPLLSFKNIVLTAWGSDVLLFPQRSKKIACMVRQSIRGSALITAPAAFMLDRICRLAGIPVNRTAVIRWSVDIDEYTDLPREAIIALRARFGIGPDDFVFLNLRNLSPVYNTDIVLKAFAQIAPKYPRAKLLFKYGSNENLGEIQQLIRTYGIEAKVIMAGAIPSSELNLFLKSAQAGISVPSSDGGPVSCMEAMAGRLPVIFSDIPATTELLGEQGRAEVVPVRDAGALARAMERFLNGTVDTGTMVEQNYRRIQDLGDHTGNIRKIVPLYRELLFKT